MKLKFGTSGMRGIYGESITEEIALKIGRGYPAGKLIIGRDYRDSGGSLALAMKSGAISSGKEVGDYGILPTPALAFASIESGADAIMITASHNPEEYNGFKIIRNGLELSKGKAEAIDFEQDRRTGNIGRVEKKRIKERYLSRIIEKIEGKVKIRVVVDSNGAASRYTPELLRRLGCEVICLNCEGDGFNRKSEPKEGNLDSLKRAVRVFSADLGIAHDGDGDRIIVVDEKGVIPETDRQLSAITEYYTRGKKGKIVGTVEASLGYKETVERIGSELVITPVGSTYVGEKMKEVGGLFGGEPAGEYIFPDMSYVPDAVYGAALFAQMVSERKLSEIVKNYPVYPIKRGKVPNNGQDIEASIRKTSLEGKIDKIDGIRISSEEYWALVRKSGTEPIIRITVEAKNKNKVEEIYKELEDSLNI